MTQEKYRKVNDLEYIGKHVKKWYKVTRVVGPAGPTITDRVLGFEEAKRMCQGMWDWEVIREEDGAVVY